MDTTLVKKLALSIAEFIHRRSVFAVTILVQVDMCSWLPQG